MRYRLPFIIRDQWFEGLMLAVLVVTVFSPSVGGALFRGSCVVLYMLATGHGAETIDVQSVINFHW